MDVADELLAKNAEHAATHEQDLPAAPAKRLAVLACMDARIDVHRVFGLDEGDAHVIRNAGGLVTDDAIRSLVISQRLLGTTEIVLLHHTKCGMLGLPEDELKGELERDAGQPVPFSLGSIDDLGNSVRRSIELIEASPFLTSTTSVRGFVYDVDTGLVQEVRGTPTP